MIVKAGDEAKARTTAKKAVAKKPAAKRRTKASRTLVTERSVTKPQMIEVLNRMVDGESLRSICRDPKMPKAGTILGYVAGRIRAGDPVIQAFGEAYHRAMEVRAWTLVEDIIDLTDNVANDKVAIAKARLQLDAKKWIASKMLPDFSDKQSVELTGKDGGAIRTEVEQVHIYIPDNGRDTDVD